jgi:hypothetical protein
VTSQERTFWLSWLLISVSVAGCGSPACPAGTVQVDSVCRSNSVAMHGDSAVTGIGGTNGEGRAGDSANGPVLMSGPSGGANSRPPEPSTSGTQGGTGATSSVAGASGATDSAHGPAAGSAGAARPPGSPACTSTDKYRCSAEGSGKREQCVANAWIAASACAPGEVCAGKDSTKPGECLAVAMVCAGKQGLFTCDGQGTLYKCDENGVIAQQNACGKSELCVPGVSSGHCATCAPGTFKCQGAQLMMCPPTGEGFTMQEPCASMSLCDDKAGKCMVPACTAGQYKCMGDDLYQCNQQQTALERAQSCGTGLCDAARGTCAACVSGNKRCSGTTLLTCNSNGSAETPTSCPAKCSDGACVECTGSDTRACGSGCDLGINACVNGHFSTTCSQPTKPTGTPETCNGKDDDCDAHIDECDDPNLHCTTGTTTAGMTMTKCLPPGSYTASCEVDSCSVSGNRLTCRCWGGGTGVLNAATTVTLPCANIYQYDGKLCCGTSAEGPC